MYVTKMTEINWKAFPWRSHTQYIFTHRVIFRTGLKAQLGTDVLKIHPTDDYLN